MAMFKYEGESGNRQPSPSKDLEQNWTRLPAVSSGISLEMANLLKGGKDLQSFRRILSRSQAPAIQLAIEDNLAVLNNWPIHSDLNRVPFLRASMELAEKAGRIPASSALDKMNESMLRKLLPRLSESHEVGLEARCGMKLADFCYYRSQEGSDREAIRLYERALPNFEKVYGLSPGILHGMSNLIDLFLKHDRCSDAERYCGKVEKIVSKSANASNVRLFVGALKVCGATYREQGDLGQAEGCYHRIVDIADHAGAAAGRLKADAYFRLSLCRSFLGDDVAAWEYAALSCASMDTGEMRVLEEQERALTPREMGDLRTFAKILKRNADTIAALFSQEDALPYYERACGVLERIGESRTPLYREISGRLSGTDGASDMDSWGKFDGWQSEYDSHHFD